MARPVRIANCSGFYGDRLAAAREMLAGPVDVLTGDYLAELTMLILWKARQKDSGRRCDLEAGMAKLLAARVAWAAADNAVQIHGGNGFALEYPVSRVLCDARRSRSSPAGSA